MRMRNETNREKRKKAFWKIYSVDDETGKCLHFDFSYGACVWVRIHTTTSSRWHWAMYKITKSILLFTDRFSVSRFPIRDTFAVIYRSTLPSFASIYSRPRIFRIAAPNLVSHHGSVHLIYGVLFCSSAGWCVWESGCVCLRRWCCRAFVCNDVRVPSTNSMSIFFCRWPPNSARRKCRAKKERNEKAKAKITIMVIICHFH